MKIIFLQLIFIAFIIVFFIADIISGEYKYRRIAAITALLLFGTFNLPCGYGDNLGAVFYVIIAVLSVGFSLFYNFYRTPNKKGKTKALIVLSIGFAVSLFFVFPSACKYINLNYGAETTRYQAVINETITKHLKGRKRSRRNITTTDYYCIVKDTGEKYYFSLKDSEKQEFEQKTGGEKKEGDTLTYIKGKGCLGIEFTYPNTRIEKENYVSSFFSKHDTTAGSEY